jgi:hypothetical protein
VAALLSCPALRFVPFVGLDHARFLASGDLLATQRLLRVRSGSQGGTRNVRCWGQSGLSGAPLHMSANSQQRTSNASTFRHAYGQQWNYAWLTGLAVIAGKGDAPRRAAAVRGTRHRVFSVDCGRRRSMARLIPTAPRPFLPCPRSWRWCSCSGFLTSLFPDRTAPAGNFARACQQRIFAFWPSAPDSPLPAGGPWLWSCLLRLSDYKCRDHPSLA